VENKKIRLLVTLFTTFIILGPVSGDVCKSTQIERIVCYEGDSCRDLPCERQPSMYKTLSLVSNVVWGTDPNICFGSKQGSKMQLCKRQFYDLISGKYVSIPSYLCSSECID
jgi:hypothetical protein